MRTPILLAVSAALLLPACATRREEIRDARQDLRQERAECAAARRSGDMERARVECGDRRDARRDVQDARDQPR